MRTRPTRWLTVLAWAALLGLAGCSTAAEPAVVSQANTQVAPAEPTADATAATTRTETLQLNGAQRSYLVMTPAAAHAAPLPLVIVLHGAFVTGSEELTRTGFGSLADRGAAVVVAPESVGPAWNSDAGCCGVAATDHVDDAAFVSTVVTHVQRSEHTDPMRVSVVGYSSGGKLAYNVACVDHPAIAAVATYGAGPQLPCRNSTPITFAVGYGDKDANEPMLGAPHDAHGVHQPMVETVAQLRKRDGCATAPTHQRTAGPASITTWGSRTADTVTQIVWHGSTHQWPGSAPDVPPQASGEALYWPLLAAAHLS